jgi:hypothetical protein
VRGSVPLPRAEVAAGARIDDAVVLENGDIVPNQQRGSGS